MPKVARISGTDHRGRKLALLAAVAFIAPCVAYAQNRYNTGKPDFVNFSTFMAQTAAARSDDFSGKEGVRVRDAAAFEEMKAHLLGLYRGVHVRHSFIDGGNTVDCVPIDEQPALRGASDAEKQEARHLSNPVSPPRLPESGRAGPGKPQDLARISHNRTCAEDGSSGFVAKPV